MPRVYKGMTDYDHRAAGRLVYRVGKDLGRLLNMVYGAYGPASRPGKVADSLLRTMNKQLDRLRFELEEKAYDERHRHARDFYNTHTPNLTTLDMMEESTEPVVSGRFCGMSPTRVAEAAMALGLDEQALIDAVMSLDN